MIDNKELIQELEENNAKYMEVIMKREKEIKELEEELQSYRNTEQHDISDIQELQEQNKELKKAFKIKDEMYDKAITEGLEVYEENEKLKEELELWKKNCGEAEDNLDKQMILNEKITKEEIVEKEEEEKEEEEKEEEVTEKVNTYFKWCDEWCKDNLKNTMPFLPFEYKICNGLQDEMERDMVEFYNENKDELDKSIWNDDLMNFDEDGKADNHADVGCLADHIQDYFKNTLNVSEQDMDNWYTINDAIHMEEKIDDDSEVAYYNVLIEITDDYDIEITDTLLLKIKKNYKEHKNYTLKETKKSIVIEWRNPDMICTKEIATRNIIKKNM